MRLGELTIENYKALKDIRVPLSRFVCFFGENNAGKSSVLQALKLLIDGGTLNSSHFYDATRSVRVQLTINDITEADVQRLAEEHRAKVAGMLRNGTLVLARIFESDKKSSLKHVARLPKDPRFNESELSELLAGKVSNEMRAAIEKRFPELEGKTKEITKIGDMRAAVYGLAADLPDDQTEPRDKALETGIDASVLALLPEPIYIPAVKDLSDDVKTAATTPFGRILKVLLDVIAPKLAEQQVLFDGLNAKLNRVMTPDGQVSEDQRLSEIKLIEATVEKFIQESFSEVRLRIEMPPPKLQTILSGAQIIVDDGVEGLIDTKGDGLKRAVVFSILRSYVELNRPGKLLPIPTLPPGEAAVQMEPIPVAQALPAPRPYLLLFEEPELYLYPKAQQILFEALSLFSKTHAVLVTTHSPAFFGPDGTTLFVKMRKNSGQQAPQKPSSRANLVDVSIGDARDQFQLVCYENNNIAFFADRVVLVEGDSDFIVVPHIANLLRPGWATGRTPTRFAKIGGKSNIVRYKAFFERFGMTVFVLTDLDFLLGSEYSKVVTMESLRQQRNALLASVDAYIDANGGFGEPDAKHVKNAVEKADVHALWRRAREVKERYDKGTANANELAEAINAFFAWEKYWPRREVLEQPPSNAMRSEIVALITALRAYGIFVWEKGAIEDYYPAGVVGDGKPAQAIDCCSKVKTIAEARALCAIDHLDSKGAPVSEFDAIFSYIIDQ